MFALSFAAHREEALEASLLVSSSPDRWIDRKLQAALGVVLVLERHDQHAGVLGVGGVVQ
jgi:hypothetical protein